MVSKQHAFIVLQSCKSEVQQESRWTELQVPAGCTPPRGSRGQSAPGPRCSSILKASAVWVTGAGLPTWHRRPCFCPFSIFTAQYDHVGHTWVLQASLLLKSADQQRNAICDVSVPLPWSVTCPRVPGSRAWTSGGGRSAAHPRYRQPLFSRKGKRGVLLFEAAFS